MSQSRSHSNLPDTGLATNHRSQLQCVCRRHLHKEVLRVSSINYRSHAIYAMLTVHRMLCLVSCASFLSSSRQLRNAVRMFRHSTEAVSTLRV